MKKDEVLLATTDEMAGYKLVETIGLVQGATFQKLEIKNLKQMHNLLENARMNSLKKIMSQARQLGCNAILGIRFETKKINKKVMKVLVYGTSVKVKKS